MIRGHRWNRNADGLTLLRVADETEVAKIHPVGSSYRWHVRGKVASASECGFAPTSEVAKLEAETRVKAIAATPAVDITPPPHEGRRLAPQQIRDAAKAVADIDRIPDPVMLDTILRDYWRMRRPSKVDLLDQYRERCVTGLPKMWQEHHAQMVVFLESILPTESTS